MFELDRQLKDDTIELGDFPLSKTLLINNKYCPWIILVPMRANITEIFELSKKDQLQLQKESQLISKLMMALYAGDKFNTAALGNVVSQLHIHHIVRFKNDPAWPKPVWGNLPNDRHSKQTLERIINELIDRIKTKDIPFKQC